jgi:hypothetical protein
MKRKGTRKGKVKGVELQTDENTPEVYAGRKHKRADHCPNAKRPTDKRFKVRAVESLQAGQFRILKPQIL